MSISKTSEHLVIQNGNYIRTRPSYESTKLCNDLKHEYNTSNILLTSSEKSALSVSLQTLIMQNLNYVQHMTFIHSMRFSKIVNEWKKYYGFESFNYDPSNRAKLFSYVDLNKNKFNFGNNVLIVSSSETNDELIKILRQKSRKLYVIVEDIQFDGFIQQNPLTPNVDIVISSFVEVGVIATKNEQLCKNMFKYIRINGLHVSPHSCDMITTNIASEFLIEKMSDVKTELCNILQERYSDYHDRQAIVTPSGMNAISIVLQSILNDNIAKCCDITVFYSNELYCDSPSLIKEWQNYYGYYTKTFDPANFDSLYNSTYKNKINIMFTESCSNPNGYHFDYDSVALQHFKKQSSKFFLIVDNTWLTEVIHNPFDYGADVVVSSLTKYYSAGQCIAGAIWSKNNQLHDIFENYANINGCNPSAHNCRIICDAIMGINIPNIDERIAAASKITCDLLDKLKSDRRITIAHPYLKSQLANKIYPSVFTIRIQTNINNAKRLMQSSQLDYATSFGSQMSRFDTWLKEDGSFTIIRLSIGYDDDCERVFNEIEKMLNKI